MTCFTDKELEILETGLDYVFDINASEFREIFKVKKKDYGYLGEKIAKMREQLD